MSATAPNWTEQVVAIATGILALGVIGAGAAAVFGAQQVREARRSREAHMAAEFFRRWNEDSLVQSRRLVARFSTPEELASAFQRYMAADAPEAHVLYRELDYFEQPAALGRLGAFDFTLIELLVGRSLIERWDLWSPALHAVHGDDASHVPRSRCAHESAIDPKRPRAASQALLLAALPRVGSDPEKRSVRR